MKAIGHANWTGSWKNGSGTLATETPAARDMPYTFSSRFEGAPGASPEELLAVAQAGCFNQALANNFGMIGLEASRIETSVAIDLIIDDEGHPKILGLHVTVAAAAPDITQEQFERCAERARTNCTIAKLLNQPLGMTATLLD